MKKLLLLSAAAFALQASAADAAWSFISTGSEQTYGIKADGSLWAWGSAEYGELGIGTKSPAKVSTPTQVGTDTDWAFAAGGSGRGFFIKTDGTMWSAGTAEGGVLGTNSTAAQLSPAQIGTDSNWKFVTTSNAGDNYGAFAIKTDGSLWAWGKSEVGFLGYGNYSTKAVPQQIGTDTDWVSVSLGRSHSLALKSDGSIWGAGEGGYGQLGAEHTGYNSSLVKVSDGPWTDVFAIDNASYALKADGTLWAWGENYYDILGVGLPENDKIYTPTQITTITGSVKYVSGSQYFRAVAVCDGTDFPNKVYTWGKSVEGCIGNGTGVAALDAATAPVYTTPQAVALDADIHITNMSCGQLFTVIETAEGKLIGWGQNAWGQLGTSEPENMLGNFKTTPIEVAAANADPSDDLTFDAQNIPAALSNVEKFALTGEWGTDDLLKLIPAIGNGQGVMGYNFNTVLKTIDMSQVTFKAGTSLSKVFRNCKALETVIFPSNESVANIVSLDNAFTNDEVLTSINIEELINVANLAQAFQNCKKLQSVDLSAWTGVNNSEMAFNNCNALTTVALPASFVISDRCFGGDYALALIDWSLYNSTQAPKMEINDNFEPFYGVDFVPADKQKIIIIVPAAAYASFTADSYWNGFNIQAAAEPGTYTVDADEITASLTDAKHIILTGSWNTEKFKALATALGTAASITAGNSTLLSIDMSAAQIEEGTKLTMQVPGALFGTTAKGVFQKYTALENVIFPSAAEAAHFSSFEQAFYGCTALKSIDLSNLTGLTNTVSAFYGCEALESVVLPASIPLQKEMFDRCEAMKTIDWSKYEGTTAPTYSNAALPDIFIKKDLTVIVPEQAYDAFIASSAWNVFTIVKATSGIESVESEALAAPKQVYNIRGQYITTLPTDADTTALPAGLYIIAGKKVLVK